MLVFEDMFDTIIEKIKEKDGLRRDAEVAITEVYPLQQKVTYSIIRWSGTEAGTITFDELGT